MEPKKNQFKMKTKNLKIFFSTFSDPEPDRDWFAIIFLFIIIFIIIIIWTTAMYFLYFPPAPSVQVANVSSQSVDEKRLNEILASYEARKNKMTDLENNPPVFVDPSL